MVRLLSAAALWVVASVLLLPETAIAGQRHHKGLSKRQAQYQYIADEQDPIKAAEGIQQMQYVPNNSSQPNSDWLIIKDDGGTSNPPWLAQIPFVATPQTEQQAMAEGRMGWKKLPDMDGFTLNRTWTVVPGLSMPMYITQNYRPGQDNSHIQRAIITMPGKPRDSWKYANLFRNALAVAASNPANGISADQVMIVGPAFLNSDDKDAGAVRDGELYWHGSQWQSGHRARNEQAHAYLSSYHILDNITDWIFTSGEFPGMKQVVFGGHSMGGQAVQRYAVLKKTKAYDSNVHFWVGNPGSWAWLDDQRPYPNDTCAGWNKWGYGLGNVSAVVRYARRDVNASREAVVERFRSRKVHYAVGLADTGPGDTHCQAKTQGGSHLDRGSQFVLSLGRLGGFPPSQTFDVIEGTSHQDYPMIRAEKSVRRIFLSDFNESFPLLTNTTNPGDRPPHKPHGPQMDKNKPPKLKMFSTPKHRIIATGLLGGSIAGVIAFFTLLPFFFADNYDDRSYEAEMSARRRLLSISLDRATEIISLHSHRFSPSTPVYYDVSSQTTVYEEAVQLPFSIGKMVGSCLHIRQDLTDCILKSDCYLKDGKSGQECITSHMAELPLECQQLYKSFVECRRGMLDMRKRFRGNAPPAAGGNNAPGGTSQVDPATSPSS